MESVSLKLMSALLLSCLLMLPAETPKASATPTTIVVPDDYPTIQEAVDNAERGDTIFVREGVYHEGIMVGKALSLIGENREATVIEASPSVTGVTITSDNVVLQGFTLRHCNWGVVVQSSGCLISGNCIMQNEMEGVFLDGRSATVSDNVVANNLLLNNRDAGMLVWASHQNCIKSNTMKGNAFGLYLYTNATRNLIKRNEISSNSWEGVVLAWGSSWNTITHNNISGNRGAPPPFRTSGISLLTNSVSNQITFNVIQDNECGIEFSYFSGNNTVASNSFIGNTVQVSIDSTCAIA